MASPCTWLFCVQRTMSHVEDGSENPHNLLAVATVTFHTAAPTTVCVSQAHAASPTMHTVTPGPKPPTLVVPRECHARAVGFLAEQLYLILKDEAVDV